jgi:hypothetical protein
LRGATDGGKTCRLFARTDALVAGVVDAAFKHFQVGAQGVD